MKVKIYLTPTCAYCEALKRFLEGHNINFEEIDIAADKKKKEEIIQRTGKMEVPVVEIDGELIVGFEKEKISKLLNL